MGGGTKSSTAHYFYNTIFILSKTYLCAIYLPDNLIFIASCYLIEFLLKEISYISHKCYMMLT